MARHDKGSKSLRTVQTTIDKDTQVITTKMVSQKSINNKTYKLLKLNILLNISIFVAILEPWKWAAFKALLLFLGL